MSSQAKCWMFNEGTLRDCRQDACNTNGVSSKAAGGKPRVRKFACGYHSRKATSTATPNNRDTPPTTAFSSKISPNAIFPMLKRGASVLSTAIMLFRKFYLSNSVVDFHPRNIAAASALLAVKTDCERNLPVSQYFHQSVIILRFVSIFHDRIAIPFNLRRIAQRAKDLNFLADMRGLHSK
jgi:hypothetical protein